MSQWANVDTGEAGFKQFAVGHRSDLGKGDLVEEESRRTYTHITDIEMDGSIVGMGVGCCCI